jgi:very-short-patch-repair endonuclease
MDAPLSAAMELAALIKERQVLNQEIQAVPRGNEIRDLIRDHHDVERVVAAARWVHEVRCASLPEKVVDLLLRTDGGDRQAELTPPSVRAAEAARDLAKAANTAAAEFGVAFDANDNLSLAEKLARLTERRKELPYQLSMAATRRELRNAGLGSFVAAIEKSSIPPSAFSDVFDRIVTNKRADRVRKANQRLRDATGLTLNGRRKAFAEQDRLKIGHDRKLAASAMLRRDLVPGRNAGPKKGWTEMALVNNEVKKLDGEDDKRRRFAPVRSLLAQAPGSIRALKPCFMMSPLSVSKFLPRYMEFDVVVIDEASQMRPEDALGALLRAKQIVVVGDPKQLPPTDFFNRAIDGADTDDEEQEDIEDESILEACSKAFDKVRRLKWHYRSRCESLIAFSNEQFYDRSLITFPMAKPESFSVDLVKVAGHYQASQNPAEAQRVCEEAIDLMCRLADAPDAEFGTIGVVAVNSQQREAIVEQFRLLSAGNEAVETFMSRAEQLGEPFFVKNLENVQGDERDYVMISLTYGRAPGKAVVNQTFGPINRSQGHRRLNVLFSRARRRVGLFSSMASTDIRPSETSKLGVHILKRYLEYAERGRSAPGAVTGKPFDSPFEEEVCRRLVDLGYKVDVQVGVSKFRIDLGIRHPLHPSIYLAGVECDGAAFHSSRSARDRDRLREEVLRGLGWSLVRIWSTDWFSNPDTATERLVKQLKDLEALPVHIESEIVFGTNAPDISPPLGAKVDAQAEAPVAPTAESPATEVPSVQPAPLASEDSEVSSLPDPPKIVAAPPVRPNVRAASTPPKTLLQQDLFNRTPPTQSDLFAESDTPKKRNESLPLEPSLSKKTGRLTSAEARQALVELRSEIAAKLPEAEAHRCILRDIMIDHFLKLEHCDEAQSMWFRLPTHLRSGTDPAQKREFLEIIFDIVDRRNA